MLVVASKIKNLVKSHGMRSSKEFLEALSEKVGQLLAEAESKAKSDGRKTVKPEDL